MIRSASLLDSLATRARLAFALFLLSTGIPGCRKRQASGPPDVLLVIVDTLRADRTGEEHMPFVHSLSEKGVHFTRAYAQAPYTSPSHASILTSSYPSQHGVRDNGHTLGPELATWAELLSAQGYRTAAFVSGYPLLAKFGFNRGFHVYDDQMQKNNLGDPFSYLERAADATTSAAVSWLKTAHSLEAPLFLWVHYFDPHSPYVPPPTYEKLGAYEGEVRFVDDCVKALMTAWREQRSDRKKLLVFVSDHGEGLGEHGEMEHSTFLYDTTIRVPLIFCGHGVPSGKIVEDVCETVDVLPTVLDLTGMPQADSLSGRSLAPLWQGRKASDASYSETFSSAIRFGWSELRCLVDWPWKYVSAPQPELYKLDQDPGETQNLIQTRKKKADALKASLYRHAGASEKMSPTAASAFSQANLRALRQLGYLSSGAKATASSLPPDERVSIPKDPKDMLQVIDLVNRAMNDVAMGQLENARRGLERALGQDPENPGILRMLGEIYRDLDDPETSLAFFEKAIEARPPHLAAEFGKTTVLLRMERMKEALESIEQCLRWDPQNAEFLNTKGVLQEGFGNEEEAEQCYLAALSTDPEKTETWFNLGRLRFRTGNGLGAKEAYERVLSLSPQNKQAEEALADLKRSR